MKAVSVLIGEVEKKILRYFLNNNQTTIKDIAESIGYSGKTVSKYLENLQSFLSPYGLVIRKKTGVGVCIEGDMTKLLDANKELEAKEKLPVIPSDNEERVIYVCKKLIAEDNYVTLQILSDEMFVSKNVSEKIIFEVDHLLQEVGVPLLRKPGKGIKLICNEEEKRKIVSKLINTYWDGFWSVQKEKTGFLRSFHSLNTSYMGLFSKEDLEIIVKVLEKFIDQKKLLFTDYAFQSLVVHIAIAVERMRQGQIVAEKVDIQPTSFSEAEELKKKLEAALHVSFPVTEINLIGVHLDASRKKEHVGQEDDNFLKKLLLNNVPLFDEELINGLELHLRAAINRIKLGLSIYNPYIESIKQDYVLAFEEALTLKVSLEQEYKLHISDDETGYIALHIQAFKERNKHNDKQLRVALVCSSGLGTSQLLNVRIKKAFPEFNIQEILSLSELLKRTPDVDFIISTVMIDALSIPSVVVDPFLEEASIFKINAAVKSLENTVVPKTKTAFKKLITKENIALVSKFTSIAACLDFIEEKVCATGYAKTGLATSALARERLSYTSHDSFALPHADPAYIKKTFVYIIQLKHPLLWGGSFVNKVFFMGINQQEKINFEELYEELYELVSNKKKVDQLFSSQTVDDLYKNILI